MINPNDLLIASIVRFSNGIIVTNNVKIFFICCLEPDRKIWLIEGKVKHLIWHLFLF